MARISGALFSQATGSVGNLTLSTQKGRIIMKSKATVVSNPNTAGQQRQRMYISRAVLAWKSIGNILKSGITSLVQYGSQYNTYVSKNAQFFTTASFDADSFINKDLEGSVASIGSYPQLSHTVEEFASPDAYIQFTNSSLKNTAKVGDMLVLVAGNVNGSGFSYSEVQVTDVMIANSTASVNFQDLFGIDVMNVIYCIFLVSADGSYSSSSTFMSY